MITGAILLSLPIAQSVNVSGIDALFISASAVSTTGLVTIDLGTSFTFWGELIVLVLIQIGGIGYMTFGSFILLSLKHRALNTTLRISKKAFLLPKGFKVSKFIKKVVIFTMTAEIIGAIFLYALFARAGEENALWFAIFHSVSAFCTAGFSLMSTSFEAYSSDVAINLVIASLSLIGAIGFIVLVDLWDLIRGKHKYLHFTSKVILKVTLGFVVFGTAFVALAEPLLQTMTVEDKWLAAFFQVMTATTTVGFNTVPIGSLTPAVIFFLYFLMLFGASPSGTGGGLKSTTFAALAGLVKSTLKGRDKIRLNKRVLSLEKLQIAASSFVYYFFILLVAVVLLLLLENAPMPIVLFEVFSALGTVGLSMGLTGELSEFGKLIIIILMFMGRVGILTFGIVISTHDETRLEESDNDLVI
ncbi:K+ transporter Trk [Glaciecola sp. KUL10]|nr:K+ transporter Trk [Glaciecola sp. KUL10]